MKDFKPKIVVAPHFSGSAKTTEVFRKVIAEQIENKLNKNGANKETTANENNS